MEKHEINKAIEPILEGYKDVLEGRFFKSTGDFKSDLEIFKNKEKNNWQ